MACEETRDGDGNLVSMSCTRRAPVPCGTCGSSGVGKCQFALSGSKAGEKCGRSVCRSHRYRYEGKTYCRIHHAVMVQRGPDEKE